MAKKKVARSVNRSDAVRKHLASNPDAKPKEVVAALRKEGLTVTTALVSRIKWEAKQKNGQPKRRGRPKAVKTTPQKRASASRAPSTAALADALPALLHAKKLADAMGGIDKAREAVDALSKLS